MRVANERVGSGNGFLSGDGYGYGYGYIDGTLHFRGHKTQYGFGCVCGRGGDTGGYGSNYYGDEPVTIMKESGIWDGFGSGSGQGGFTREMKSEK